MAKVAEKEGRDPQLQRQDPKQPTVGATVAIVEVLFRIMKIVAAVATTLVASRVRKARTHHRWDSNATHASLSKEESMEEAATTAPSYKDKLLVDGVVENSSDDLSFDAILDYLDEGLDVDDDPEDPNPVILFSKEEKRRMREPWTKALIIKTFGKTVGYNFLYGSIKAQWKPIGALNVKTFFKLVKSTNSRVTIEKPSQIQPNGGLVEDLAISSVDKGKQPIAQTSTSLEDSLLTVKDRIKNLEKGSGFAKQNPTLSKTPKLPLEIKHGVASGDNNLLSGQFKPSNPSISQQKCTTLEQALDLILSWGKKTHPQWKEEVMFQVWHRPMLTLKSINPAPFLSSVLASMAVPSVLTDLCNMQKLGSTFEGANTEGKLALTQLLKFTAQAWEKHLQVSVMMCKMEMIHVIGKTLVSLEIKKELDYECMMLPYQFLDALMMLSHKHSPSIMLILETKLAGSIAREATAKCGFPYCNVVDFEGRAKGLWLLWNDEDVCINVVTSTYQAIHAIVKELNALVGIHQSLSLKPFTFLTTLERDLTWEYERILKLEEDLWFMKSKTNWMVDGDRNSKFFHLSTICHRSHNRIHCLRVSTDEWINDQGAITNLIKDHFKNLFSSSLLCSYHDSFSNLGVSSMAFGELSMLDAIPNDMEIHDALFGLKSFKAPGPDSLHLGFFQKLWESVKNTLCTDIKNIFASATIPIEWNECLVTLIHKTKSPETVHQFRPIGLCNSTYKIISKILVNRMKPVLDSIMLPCQASFVPGRKGIDNVLILQELVYFFSKKKGKDGDMIVKLDLEKAYDRLEWSFIREALMLFKLPANFISLILSCMSSSSISILVNGERTNSFLPSRGIRQGDPISPYLFILCMEYLSIKISTTMAAGRWKGSKAGKKGPTLSHLFFADDLIFVGKASQSNCHYLKDTLDFFCSRSSQQVNTSKSIILFSKNVDQNTHLNICQDLSYQQTNEIGKYLGIPISPKRISKTNCQFILEKIRSKLSGWKTKFFSMAGGLTLISSVLTSIPNFYMQVMWLPSSIHKEIDRISNNFLWGSVDAKHKLHLIGWDTMCQPKAHGGLGLRMIKNVSKGTQLFKLGIKWIPRNGHSIRFWFDHWVGKSSLESIFFGPFIRNAASILLADVLQEGVLDLDTIGYHFPQDMLLEILTIPMSHSDSRVDDFSWREESNGIFSSASAYKTFTFHGCGGLIRDSQGQWVVGFMRNIGHTTSLAAELWVIRDGLSMANYLQIQNSIVEIDCQVAHALLSGTFNPHHPHSTLILDCRELLCTLPWVQLKHVMRKSNMVADALAKKGARSSYGLHILYDCPPNVDLLYTADIVGVCYPKS
ncbi:hypothetical protein SLEP1_g50939 [Rubroshorea leprosula]|uniref:Reverse transcriptase domain-containing protein n=1 Tax=Rubroshorea leprosula TaxID=152421 RepID=A0AAV5M2H5_9ROSI|nr:hypothetical protein SLEP1_g50939 [Rubroshorea leprosula]